MKLAVYAICKNESSFVDRWVDSMSEADVIVVLDTGSTDGTPELLRKRGVQVTEKIISPWRFDTARNLSLSLVPTDIDACICTDLDEVFEHGWREKLEKCWNDTVGQARYRYTWSFNSDGSEGVVFYQEKIHRRHGYRWVHPVHEVLKWVGDGSALPMVTANGVQLNHYPDRTKPRSQYLPLLELSVKEEPNDDRNVHYLGREYMYYRRWDDCIRTLTYHLSMPGATWRDERAASMRYIARAYQNKGELQKAKEWLLYSILQAPYLRESYIELALLLYKGQEWDGVIYFTSCALKIKERPESYICEAEPWGSLPHDLRSIAYYNTSRYKEALDEINIALSFEPQNERFLQNADVIQGCLLSMNT